MEEKDIEAVEKEYDAELEKNFVQQLNIEKKRLSDNELRKTIVAFLAENCICTLATCSNNVPRSTPVRYRSKDLTIYILAEGGMKIKNILENNQVAIGIGTSARTSLSVRGVNIWGTAEVFNDESKEYAHALELFKPIIQSMEKSMGGEPLKIPKGILRVIRVTPSKMVYHHNSNGIKNAYWTAD